LGPKGKWKVSRKEKMRNPPFQSGLGYLIGFAATLQVSKDAHIIVSDEKSD